MAAFVPFRVGQRDIPQYGDRRRHADRVLPAHRARPGPSNYNFRIFGRPSLDQKILDDAVALFMKVSLEEDLPTQVSSQIMMEAGAVPSVLFGKRESCLTGMHKGYDEAIGHDAATALR